MRFNFPNDTRVKKAAVRFSNLLPAVSLSTWHTAIARALGYRDWHEFQLFHSAEAPTPLDETLPTIEFRARMADLCLSMASATGLPSGEIQYAIQFSRLTGNRHFTLADHEWIRCACWRSTVLPWRTPRAAGAIVFGTGTGGRRRAYLRHDRVKGGTAICVTDSSIDSCYADFEIRSPRIRADDFVPARLYLPYGYWEVENGTKIIFSRNYKPLWEILRDGSVRRAVPWRWIKNIKAENWFGGSKYAEVTWYETLKSGIFGEVLATYRINGLPILADVLPIVINNDERSLDAALHIMRESALGAVAAE